MIFIKNSKREIIFVIIVSIFCLLCSILSSSNNIKELSGNQSYYAAIESVSEEERTILKSCFEYLENSNSYSKGLIDYTTYKIAILDNLNEEDVEFSDSDQQFKKGDLLVFIGNTLPSDDDKKSHAYVRLIIDKDTKNVKGCYPIK